MLALQTRTPSQLAVASSTRVCCGVAMGITNPSLESVCSPIRLTRPGASRTTSGGRPNRISNPVVATSVKRHLDMLQFGGGAIGIGVGGEHAGADLAAGEILQAIRHAVRRVELDVEVRLGMRLAVGGRLVKDH